MESKLTTLTLADKDTLIDQLIHAGYGFAAWSMPQSSEVQMIISLNTVQATEEAVSDLSSGFLVNSFADNHPVKPYFIASDIILKGDHVKINPKITASEIDTFLSAIEQSNPKSPANQLGNARKTSEEASDFERMVAEAVEEIRNGEFEKVVLSRTKDEPLPDDFNAWDFFTSVNDAYHNAFCSLSFVPTKGIWIGASPELLISDNQYCFKTVSLAGTKRLEDSSTLGDIAWTQKEIEEQAFVSRYIINCFKKIRLREFHEHGPKTIKAGNLAHLKTEFEVKYDELNFEGLAEQMLELLHPTSAVCGMPIERAKPWIEAKERYDREFYAGFLGPINFEGSTDLFVNLRCVKVEAGKMRFFAGAGITEDSNPQKEFEETELKMGVLRSLL